MRLMLPLQNSLIFYVYSVHVLYTKLWATFFVKQSYSILRFSFVKLNFVCLNHQATKG